MVDAPGVMILSLGMDQRCRGRDNGNTDKMVSFCIVFVVQLYEGEEKLECVRA